MTNLEPNYGKSLT